MTVRPLLIYPEKTSIALSNLAVHWFFNSFSDLKPDLMTTDSGRGVFYKTQMIRSPLIFVSFSYGTNIFNFAAMLRTAGIPLLKKDRSNGMFPVFICGGIAALLNPEPLTQIFDAVLLGEGECMTEDIVNMLNMDDRAELFEFIDKLDYSMTEGKLNAKPVFAPNGSFFVHSSDFLHSLGNEFGNRHVIEMNRGCTSRCRFCAASYAYRTFRTPDCMKITEYCDRVIEKNEGLALMGTTVADVECFDEILEKCALSGCNLSLSSLKVTEINEKRVALLKQCKIKTVTVAIESADVATRESILKKVTDEDIYNALKILKNYGLKSKIYLIAGLPGTDPEKEAEKVCQLLEKLEKMNALSEVTLSVAPFSPKPLTPFHDAEFIGKKEYRKYRTALIKGTKHLKIKVKADFFSYSESELDYKTGVLKGEEFLNLINENTPEM